MTFLDISLEKLHCHLPNVKKGLLEVEITYFPSAESTPLPMLEGRKHFQVFFFEPYNGSKPN